MITVTTIWYNHFLHISFPRCVGKFMKKIIKILCGRKSFLSFYFFFSSFFFVNGNKRQDVINTPRYSLKLGGKKRWKIWAVSYVNENCFSLTPSSFLFFTIGWGWRKAMIMVVVSECKFYSYSHSFTFWGSVRDFSWKLSAVKLFEILLLLSSWVNIEKITRYYKRKR